MAFIAATARAWGLFDELVWPASLAILSLGSALNRAIDEVVWPASVQRLVCGHCFHKATDYVA